MKRVHLLVLGLGIFAATAFALRSMAADDPAGPPPQDGGQGGPGGPPPDGPGGRGGPGGPGGGFHLLPRFVADQLKLTDEQAKQIAELEKETKAKLEKILSPEQKKILAKSGPPRRGPGGPGGRRQRRGPGSDGPDAGPAGPGGGPDSPGNDSNPPPRRQRPDSE